jgi:hypothetical protein
MLKVKCLLLITVVTLSCPASTSPRTRPNKGWAPKFSSVYTDMERDCKSAVTRKEEREMLARGQDIPQSCKGYGVYYPVISYSAVTAYVTILSKRDETFSVVLNPNSTNSTGRKLEWRLAGGRPFAVILRVTHYSGDYDLEESPFDDKYKVKETLAVKGLKGYEKINFEIDAKTPNANEKAREMADNTFLEGR